MHVRFSATLALMAGLAAIAAASPAPAAPPAISEIRLGPMIHGLEANTYSLSHPFTTGKLQDLSFEVLFRSPEIGAFTWLGEPRPAIGGTINFAGKENMVHAGLNWHLPLGATPLFVEGGLGLAAVTGYLHNAPAGYRNLGCHVMGYFQASAGANIDDHWSAMLTIEHSSHAWICGDDNDGLNAMGIRIGYRF